MFAKEPIRKSETNVGHDAIDLLLKYALVATLLMCILCTVYLVLNPPYIEKFTEFYLLGHGGHADNYPTVMDLGDSGSIIVGVVNHENRDMDYNLMVVLDDGVYRDTLYTQKISLANNDTYQGAIIIKPPMNGTRMKLDFLLYADGDMAVPYRECYLYLDVDRPYYYDFGQAKAQLHKINEV